jgi:hypothetical protein
MSEQKNDSLTKINFFNKFKRSINHSRVLVSGNSSNYSEGVVLFFIDNYYNFNLQVTNIFVILNSNFKVYFTSLLDIFKRTFGDGFLYLRGLFILFFIDACLTDDEPIWEPVE